PRSWSWARSCAPSRRTCRRRSASASCAAARRSARSPDTSRWTGRSIRTTGHERRPGARGSQEVGVPQSSDSRAIGVFESGIGGLTTVRELFARLPRESVVYFGDTARLPYGNKSGETVTRFSLEIASFLVRQHVKCIVVACNTASSHALEALRERFGVPVIGVIEPAARAAVSAATRGRIGVVGTLATVGSNAYFDAITRLAPRAIVQQRACPLFVPLVEEGWLDHEVTRMVANEYLAELKSADLDCMI